VAVAVCGRAVRAVAGRQAGGKRQGGYERRKQVGSGGRGKRHGRHRQVQNGRWRAGEGEVSSQVASRGV